MLHDASGSELPGGRREEALDGRSPEAVMALAIALLVACLGEKGSFSLKTMPEVEDHGWTIGAC